MKRQNNHAKRLRAFIKANLSKHVVVFTPGIGNPHYVNRLNPGARTTVAKETLAAFDPDSNIYGKIRFNWIFYPVVVLKDAFGKVTKTHIFDVDYKVDNATWLQVSEQALIEINECMEEYQPRFRCNAGIVFCLDGVTLSEETVRKCLEQDKTFYTVDESRDMRTEREKKEDREKLILALEKTK